MCVCVCVPTCTDIYNHFKTHFKVINENLTIRKHTFIKIFNVCGLVAILEVRFDSRYTYYNQSVPILESVLITFMLHIAIIKISIVIQSPVTPNFSRNNANTTIIQQMVLVNRCSLLKNSTVSYQMALAVLMWQLF